MPAGEGGGGHTTGRNWPASRLLVIIKGWAGNPTRNRSSGGEPWDARLHPEASAGRQEIPVAALATAGSAENGPQVAPARPPPPSPPRRTDAAPPHSLQAPWWACAPHALGMGCCQKSRWPEPSTCLASPWGAQAAPSLCTHSTGLRNHQSQPHGSRAPTRAPHPGPDPRRAHTCLIDLHHTAISELLQQAQQ